MTTLAQLISDRRDSAISGQFDLDVDTTLIRRAAVTLDRTAAGFGGSGPSGAMVSPGQFGPSEQAAVVAGLINRRTQQAVDAASQLSSIAAGLATKLRVAADAFDRADPALGPR